MTTALDLITGSTRLLGVLYKGENLSDDDAQDGLDALNEMLESWSNDSLMVVSRVRESFNLSPASSYSIGTGQTMNTARPVTIIDAFFRSGDDDYQVIPVSDEEYSNISSKSTTSPFPDYLNYDNGYPYGTIRFYPQLGQAAQFHLLSEKEITSFASLTTEANLAPGWKRAIRYNLAVELAPEYGVTVSQEVALGAKSSVSAIQQAIARNRPRKFRKAVAKRSIYTGWNE